MEIIKPNWDIFKAKYSENPQDNFEWFCYLLFCREYDKPNGILRYKNQSGIETNPVELNDKIIGWQSKFYEGKLSTHKEDLIGTLEKTKRDYPHITKIIFYTNLEWTQVHKKKGVQAEKTQAQIDSEKKAEELHIEIEWRTASYFESEFVSMTHKDISKHFFIYESKSWKEGLMNNEASNKIEMQDMTGVGVITGGIVTQNITNNYSSNEKETISDNEIKSSSEMLALKNLLKNMPIEKLKIKAYKVLPINYFASLPNTVDGIIDRLLELSVVKNSCVPIISLFEKHTSKVVIDFISYLKKVKFSHIEKFSCNENIEVEELSLLINISEQDGSYKFKIETWRYANSETHRIFDEILEIDLDNNIELTSFLDNVYKYLEEARNVYKSSLSIELILPNERVYQSFKSWESSKGISMIRKYQYVHRLQSRFLQPDDNWKNKWESLEDERINIIQHTKFIEGFSYNNELSDANYKVVLKEKIENENLLFSDIEEFGIPILLSSLSTECNVKDIKDFEFKNCQEKICTHIMDNHNNEKSDIFFMVDNPNKVPNEFKNPEQNLYDW